MFREEYDDLEMEEATRVGDTVRIRVRGAQGRYVVTLTAPDTGDPACHVKRADDAQ